MELSTPELGALAELRFQQRCVERGVKCYAPIIGTNKTEDFVINLEGRLVTVQVKKASISDHWGPRTRLNACLHGSNRPNAVERADYYAFVCFERNSIWLIPSEDIQVKQTWGVKTDRIHELDPYLF